MMFPPTKRTTPAQWTVAAWTVIVLLILIGAVAFYFAVQAEVPAQSASFRRIGFFSISLAVFVWITKRMIGMFIG
jgi:hypothetical protein